jgi:ferredoxin
LYLATRETSWRVMSVEPEQATEAETFCAVVPKKHTFTLAGGVLTGNCGACEPECPVEAIFPEDALPEKWTPFVKINAAFLEGFDKVNTLAQQYADEHNVQNPPLT